MSQVTPVLLKSRFFIVSRFLVVFSFVLFIAYRSLISGFDAVNFDFRGENPRDFFSNSSDLKPRMLDGLSLSSRSGEMIDEYSSYALSHPYDGRLYVLLSKYYREHGEAILSVRALDYAQALSPQRLDVKLEVIASNLEMGNIKEAIHGIDRVLSRYPAYRNKFFPVLSDYFSSPYYGYDSGLIFESNHDWLIDFLVFFISNSKDVSLIRSVYQEAVSAEGLPLGRVNSAYVRRLQSEGLWLEAYLIWLNALSSEERKYLANVYDGGFEALEQNAGFDWRILKVAGVQSGVYFSDNGSHALRLQFSGQRVKFAHVFQYTNLSPASYTLTGKAKMDRLETYEGLRWSVYCVHSGRSIATTEAMKGSFGWRRFETTFNVPEEGCPVQRLQLELVGKAALDFEASGIAWFDDLQIERLVR